MMQINAKPVNFKFNEYLSNGYEFLKSNFGDIFLAFIFCIIMSIIPFCGLVAVGNMYKYLRKLRRGQNAAPGEIFNFDDFAPYFILQLIIIGGIFALYIPLIIIMLITQNGGEPSPVASFIMIPYMIVVYIGVLVVALKAFYMAALISLGGVKDIKTAWNMSKIMTKDNLLSIFLFCIVVSILSQLGIILCGIGIFLTLPYLYVTNYFAFEDAMQQIEHDEIKEIGSKNEF
ncbi:hypothetical protein [Chryseobacterium daeguense]|uniref:hypothetical protein n=1 Tax=Chryseobacterium daeguense TaxID=412438 RepID=UPI00041C979B|nr:hypothetical protein [Chryseobacterium daeguense]